MNAYNSDLKLQSTSNDELVQETKLIQRRLWLNHPLTVEYLKELEANRDKLLKQAMNLSTVIPPDMTQITHLLIQAKILDNTTKETRKI